ASHRGRRQLARARHAATLLGERGRGPAAARRPRTPRAREGGPARRRQAAQALNLSRNSHAVHSSLAFGAHRFGRGRTPVGGVSAPRLTTDREIGDQAASVSPSLGSSLLPTIVRFKPICTETAVPPISIIVLPLRYQPSEPVENSFTSA